MNENVIKEELRKERTSFLVEDRKQTPSSPPARLEDYPDPNTESVKRLLSGKVASLRHVVVHIYRFEENFVLGNVRRFYVFLQGTAENEIKMFYLHQEFEAGIKDPILSIENMERSRHTKKVLIDIKTNFTKRDVTVIQNFPRNLKTCVHIPKEVLQIKLPPVSCVLHVAMEQLVKIVDWKPPFPMVLEVDLRDQELQQVSIDITFQKQYDSVKHCWVQVACKEGLSYRKLKLFPTKNGTVCNISHQSPQSIEMGFMSPDDTRFQTLECSPIYSKSSTRYEVEVKE